VKNNSNSMAISSINLQLDNLKKNIISTTDTSYNSDALINQFLNWNTFTDFSVAGTYQKSCSSNTRDYWVTDSSQCPASYTILKAGDSSSGSANCLIFPDWTAAQVSSRYSNAPIGCSATGSTDFNTIASASNAYYNAMSNYATDNSYLIDQIKNQHANLNSSFINMTQKLLIMLNNIDGIISPLVNIFKNFIGNNGLFALVNCCK